MTPKYKLICMSFDGDYKTETPYHEDAFTDIESAWEHSGDMGSRWYFYPFHFVVTESGTTIVGPPDDLRRFKGMRVRTVAREFNRFAAMPEAQNMGPEEFSCLIS